MKYFQQFKIHFNRQDYVFRTSEFVLSVTKRAILAPACRVVLT